MPRGPLRRNGGNAVRPSAEACRPWVPRLLAALLCASMMAAGLPGIRAAGGWTSPLDLSASPVDVEAVGIAVDVAGRVHVVWSAGGEVVHRVHAGAVWSAPVAVGGGTSPELAADASGGVHMVWTDDPGGTDDVYFASWTTSSGWTAPLNLSESEGSYVPADPSLAVGFDGRFAATWGAETEASLDIYVAWSDDGVLWPSLPLPSAHGSHPAIAFGEGGELQLVWHGAYDEEGSPLEVFYCAQDGFGWGLPQLVSDSPTLDSLLPSLAVWLGTTCVTWQENTAAGPAVYLSSLEGEWWDAPQQRSGPAAAYDPTVDFDLAGVGHLAWSTQDAVQHATWAPLTGVWSAIEQVAGSLSGPLGVRLATAQGDHAVWLAGAAPHKRDVFYSVLAATPPATPSPTATHTVTPTGTAIASPTATLTAIPTLTATPTTKPPHLSHRVFLPAVRRAWLGSR